MTRTQRRIAIIVIAAGLILGAVAFAYRGQLREAYGRWQRGPIPEAVSREEAQRAAAEAEASADAATETDVDGATDAAVTSTGDTGDTTNSPASSSGSAPSVNSAPSSDTNEPKSGAPTSKPAETPAPTSTPEPSKPLAKSQMNLSVLFVPQAPMKIWDEIHEDTCEEAAMLMLEAYQNDVTKMSIDEMERRLLALIDHQKEHYGGDVWKSTDAKTVLEMMHDVLGLKTAKILPVNSINDVKEQIARGRPVLLLAAGKLLKNPNFKNGGPLYHALVAKGYTETTIITNDPGTRLGADYAYKNEVLFDAIHDWNDGEVYHGAKVMIVVE